MKRFIAGTIGVVLVAGGVAGIAPAAHAATVWNFPDTSFAAGAGTIQIKDLQISDGTITRGRVYVSGNNTGCQTSSFSGSAAVFSDFGAFGCSGDLLFSVSPDGKLSVATGSNFVAYGVTIPANTSSGVTGAKVPVAPKVSHCTIDRVDSSGIHVSWAGEGDNLAGYQLLLNGGATSNPSLADETVNSSESSYTFPIALLNASVTTNLQLAVAPLDGGGAIFDSAGNPVLCTANGSFSDTAGKPSFTVIESINALTVNYTVADPWTVLGIEYQIDGGTWTRPGGTAPTGGVGGSFSKSPIASGAHTLVLRSVGKGNPAATTLSDPQTINIPAPAGKPGSASKPSSLPSSFATGSTPTNPVVAPPAQPVSTVSGTSNGAGTGTNGALAANTGDAGVDAPCLAKNGTIYPNLYSTVGSQLTMAPNTTGMPDPTSFIVTDGALPPGVILDRTFGIIYGVATQPGSWVTTVQATFPNGTKKSSQFTTRVDLDPQTLQYAALNVGVLGLGVSISPSTNAPVVGTTYKLVCGKLPAGLKLDSRTGSITGTPAEKLFLPTPLRVAETSSSGKAAASFLLIVDTFGFEAISYPAHPHLRVGHMARIRPTVIGVDKIVKFRMWKGKLPRGLRLNPVTGVITGKPLTAGPTHTITIVAVTKSGALLTAPATRIFSRR